MLPWFVKRWLGLVPPAGTEEEPVDPAGFVRPPNTAYDQAMVEAILASPDDPAAYEAYGAWLADQNDPRGPLVLSMLADEPSGAIDPLLLGPLPDLDGASVTWRWGFWHRLTLEDPHGDRVGQVLAEVLAHPSGVVLRELVVTSSHAERVPEGLADGPSLALAHLEVHAEGTLLGAWAAAWSRLQELEHLVLQGASPQLGSLSLPKLRVLEIIGPIDDQAVRDLERASLPSLERLVVSRPEPLVRAFGERVVGG